MNKKQTIKELDSIRFTCRQEKPKKVLDNYIPSGWKCPTCLRPINREYAYCPYCGQRLDWRNDKVDFWKGVLEGECVRVSDEMLKEIIEYASFVPVLSKKDKPAKDVMSIEEAKKIVDKYWNGEGLAMTEINIEGLIINSCYEEDLTKAYNILIKRAFSLLEKEEKDGI